MYSKTRNTLTALIAASLFVTGGWMLGHPVDSSASSPLAATTLQASIANAGTRITMDSTALRVRHASRMNFAMPYFSFALQTSQRRTD